VAVVSEAAIKRMVALEALAEVLVEMVEQAAEQEQVRKVMQVEHHQQLTVVAVVAQAL